MAGGNPEPRRAASGTIRPLAITTALTMRAVFSGSTAMDESLHVLWDDGERVFCRGWRMGADGKRSAVLGVPPAAAHGPQMLVAGYSVPAHILEHS